MKRTLSLILCLILLSISLLNVVSCSSESTTEKLLKLGEEERATELLKLYDKSVNALNSYTQKQTLDVSGNYLDVPVKLLGTVISAESGLKKGEFLSKSKYETQTTFTFNEVESATKESSIEGYQNGTHYYSGSSSDEEVKLFAATNKDDYISYMKEDALETSYIAKNCTVKSASQNDDLTWTATFSGAPESVIEEIAVYFGVDGFFDISSVQDVSVSILLEKDFTPIEENISFVFKFGAKDKFHASCKYSDLDKTVIEETDISSYTEVDSILAVYKAGDALDLWLDAEENSAKVTYTEKASGNGAEEETSSVIDLSFLNKNGKYSFTATTKSDDYVLSYEYTDGKFSLSMSQNGEILNEETRDYTDDEAVAYVYDLFSACEVSLYGLSDVELSEDGKTYTFKLSSPDTSVYDEIFQTTPKSADSTIIYTLDDDGLLVRSSAVTSIVYETSAGDFTVLSSYEYDFSANAE